jgi:hypothetical protein
MAAAITFAVGVRDESGMDDWQDLQVDKCYNLVTIDNKEVTI